MQGYKRYFFGEWVDGSKPLTVQDIGQVMTVAAERRAALAAYPQDRMLRLIGKLRDFWKDPKSEAMQFLREHLPAQTGFSAPMIELALEELVWVLDPARLERKLETELRGVPRAGDYRFFTPTATAMHWSPIGTVLHVLSGNVFLVGIGSLLEGLLTGNVSLLKMSSGETLFLPRFLESLQALDEDGVVSRSIALLDYPSSATGVIAALKARVDGIVVWGGEEAVRAYRSDLPAHSRLVVFGPKLSFALVTEEGMKLRGAKAVAEALAFEMSIWDQNACTAPQVCYVQGDTRAKELIEALGPELALQAEKLPPGEADVNTAVEIQKLRSVFEVAEARKEGVLRHSARGVDWTVVLDRDRRLEPSPLHRTLRLVPFEDAGDVLRELLPVRGYLQTVGLVAGATEGLSLSRRLSDHGAQRVLELGQMAGSEIDDPHDGAYDLPQLVNIVVTRLPRTLASVHPVDALSPEQRGALIDARLRKLVDKARQSAFYAKRFEGVRVDGTADLEKIFSLTRQEMEANVAGGGLKTGEYFGGYVSRSGGSTGEPKFSVYDHHDWEQMIANAVRVLEAAGLAKGDRVANCFLAGDLYGSFVSFDHINCRIGATTFAFAGQVKAETLLDVWRKFDINVIESMPTLLVPLLRQCRELEPKFTIEKILYAGTPLSPSDRLWLRESLGVKRISSIIGANDGGQLAFQCEAQSGGLHHLVDDFNFVEVVDESGHRVPEGMPGRILITSLLKYAFPLIRYEIGDSGRIVPGTCACGRTNRVLEYLGRADDMICLGSANLEYRDFLRALEGLPFSAMQLVARNEVRGELLVVKLETAEPTEELKLRVVNRMLDRVGKLAERLANGSILRIDVECLAPGSLPRNARSGKTKNVVDERK